jgi:hypothetical protein
MNHIMRHQARRLGLTYRLEVYLTSRAAEAMHTLLHYWPSRQVLHSVMQDAGLAVLIGLGIGVAVRLIVYAAYG